MDDNQWEPDEEFFLKLTYIQAEDNGQLKLGRTSIMEITILNDDGKLIFFSLFCNDMIFVKKKKNLRLNNVSRNFLCLI